MVAGIILSFAYSLGRSSYFIKSKHQWIKLFRFFFYRIWFSAYLVPVLRHFGFKGSRLMFKEVDLGWNEGVFGGIGLFTLILLVRRQLLQA